MEMTKTVKMVCALAVGTVAFALELASVAFSIPANLAGWAACKLIDVSTMLAGIKKEPTTNTDGSKIVEEIAAM